MALEDVDGRERLILETITEVCRDEVILSDDKRTILKALGTMLIRHLDPPPESSPAPPAASSEAIKIRAIRRIVANYYRALDRREDGVMAVHKALGGIEGVLGMRWVQGASFATSNTVPETRTISGGSNACEQEEGA